MLMEKDYWLRFERMDIDAIALAFGIERYDDEKGNESDAELRRRIINKYMRFQNKRGTFYDVVHTAEQAILHATPVGCDLISIRRQVGLGLIAKNKTGNWFERLKTACKAFWSCL